MALFGMLQALMHPNERGHQLMYEAMANALGSDLLYSNSCSGIISCPEAGKTYGSADVSQYIPGLELSGNTIYKNGNGIISVGRALDDTIQQQSKELRKKSEAIIRVSLGDLKMTFGDELSAPIVYLHSDPIKLGEMTLSGDEYILRATIPNSVTVGWHSVHLAGTHASGKNYDVYTQAFISGPKGDYDDDGIQDEVDTCAFAAPRGVDKDEDGIDDECEVAGPSSIKDSQGIETIVKSKMPSKKAGMKTDLLNTSPKTSGIDNRNSYTVLPESRILNQHKNTDVSMRHLESLAIGGNSPRQDIAVSYSWKMLARVLAIGIIGSLLILVGLSRRKQ